jgi:hypothetical protein
LPYYNAEGMTKQQQSDHASAYLINYLEFGDFPTEHDLIIASPEDTPGIQIQRTRADTKNRRSLRGAEIEGNLFFVFK